MPVVFRQIKLQISHRNNWLVLSICLLNTSREIVLENFTFIHFKDYFGQFIILVLDFKHLVSVAITNLVRAHSLKEILELIGRLLKPYQEAGPDLSRILCLVDYACK